MNWVDQQGRVIGEVTADDWVASMQHVADNNAVLVPKLKAGFVVSGFEITPNLGLLLQLRYVFAPLLREVHAYRVGSLADGGEVLRARGALFPVEP